MAKKRKQSNGQRRKKQAPTLKKQISSNLSKRANKLLEHYENIEALRAIGDKSESSNLLNKIDTTDDTPKNTFTSKVGDVLHKLKILKDLIVLNISNTDGKKNFSTIEYVKDRKSVVDIEFKIKAAGMIDKSDLSMMNKLYKKHKQIKQLFE